MRARERRADPFDVDEGPSTDRWLLSYADFITLLLATFVVLYAMNAADTEELREMIGGVRSAFALGDAAGGILDGEPVAGRARSNRGTISGEGETRARFEFLLLRDRVAEALGTHPQKDGEGGDDSYDNPYGARVANTDRGVVVSLGASDFFPGGGVELSAEAEEALELIATVLRTSTHHIRVEGHTDDRPISSQAFPSNWELSTARAARVTRILSERHGIPPTRLGAAGYAEHRPLVANDTDEGRAINRRIDIVVLHDETGAPVASAEEQDDSLRALLDRLPPVDETEAAGAP